MEEIRCVLEEILEEPDLKFKTTEENEEDSSEEEVLGDGGDSEEEDEDYDDDISELDYDKLSADPFVGYFDPPAPLICPGAGYTIEEAEKIVEEFYERSYKLYTEWHDMVKNNKNPELLAPLTVFPKITRYCALGWECYHLQYWTGITIETAPTHPYFAPTGMMQVFSLKLSSPPAHPINIYGTFAVRDGWEPLRNYLFHRSRDTPATISPGDAFLPLCSPSRGIYVLQHILIDIDLWIKEEGDVSADRQLFCGYLELDTSSTGFGRERQGGRFQGDYYDLDMHFAFLPKSIETAIEVSAEAENPSDVRMRALTSGFGDEIALYDGTFHGTGVMVRHFVAVQKEEQLHVLMELDGSLYKWTFQAGVGVIVAPGQAITGFARNFVMNVSFRTRGELASTWQWSCICNNVRVSALPP